MPSLATYDTPQATPAPLPGARDSTVASPGLFSAAGDQMQRFGRSAMQAGADGLDIATDMQTRQNADMVFRAETALKTEYIAFENSVRERRGQDAVGVTKQTADWWQKKAAEHADNLENPVQKYLFNQQAQKLSLPSLDVVSNYETEQRRHSLDESANASIGSSINLAAANATNPVAIGVARDDVIKRTQVRAAINGWGADMRIAEIDKNLTTLHSQVIQNLADTDPTAARAYFAANKKEINGAQYDAIDKLLKHSGALESAQQAVDVLTRLQASETEGLEHIRKEYTGEARQHAEILWKQRFAEKDAMREADQKSAADSAWTLYAKGGIGTIPASVWTRMDGKDVLAVRDRAAKDAEGKPIKTDFALWSDLNQMSIDNPKQFMQTDLRRYASVISTDDLKGFGNRQREMTTDNGKGIAELGTQVAVAHNQLGWGDGEKEKKGAFDHAVYNALEVERQKKGKDLTYTERQGVIDRMMIDGKLKGSGVLWDTRGKFYEFSDQENARDFVAKIPDTEKAKITAALQRAGKPVTDQAIADLYAAKNKLPSPQVTPQPKAPAPTAPKADYPKPTVKSAPATSGTTAEPIKPDAATSYGKDDQVYALRNDYMGKADAHMKAIDLLDKMSRDPNTKPGTVAKQAKEVARLKSLADEAYKKAHPK